MNICEQSDFVFFILSEKKVMYPILSVECIFYEIQMMVAPCKIVPCILIGHRVISGLVMNTEEYNKFHAFV